MPQKAKYSEEDYQSLYQDLAGASDSNEANEIFVIHAEKLKTNHTALKNGYVAKARWNRRKGDSTYLKQYETLFPGKVDTLATQLGQFSKNQIIEWITEFVNYPLPNMDYIKSSLEGGQNDKFFQGVLASFIMKDIEKYDELWHDHRDRIHGTLDAKATSVIITSLLIPFSIACMVFINMSNAYAGFGLVFVNILIASVGLIPLYTYKEVSDSFKSASIEEQGLIDRTNKQIYDKYPKELLDQVWNTTNLHRTELDEDDKDNIELAKRVFQGEVDFRENGLMDFAISEMIADGWYASKFSEHFIWKMPYETSKIYRYFYNKTKCNFVDVEHIKQIT